MYNNFDFNELERATQESLARIYKESLDVQEYKDPKQINETYKKVRKILECPEMEKCHPYLYSLDMDDFNDEDTEKINKIYKLGLDRGMYQDDGDTEGDEVDAKVDDECDDSAICGGPSDSLTGQQMNPRPVNIKPIFTVMYSAQKDGHGAMGEYYSMSPTIEGAKEDCINQMNANGYDDVMVMAVDKTYQGVEDDYMNDYTDHSLDGVSPNSEYNDTIEEDDSEEFVKQETGDTSSEESSEESENTENDNSEEETSTEDTEEEENTEDSTKAEETSSEKEDENTEDDAEDETDTGSEEGSDGSEETSQENDEENTEDSSEDGKGEEDEEKKLTAEEKTAMATIYTKTFKDVLKKMGLEKSVSEMTLQERTDFYTKLAEKWDKNDPADFMNDKDQEKLNKLVVKKDK